MTTDPGRLAEVEAIYDRGQYVDAFVELQKMGGPLGLTDPAAMLLASRILNNLGAMQAARYLVVRGHRRARRDAKLAYYYANYLEDRWGPWTALTFLRRFGIPAEESGEVRALLMLASASGFAALRDFEEADRLWREAAAIWEHPWLWVARSTDLAAADDWDRAHDAAARALELQSDYRPAIQQMGLLLVAKGERERAERFLTERSAGLQSPYLWMQIAFLREDLDRPAEALEALRRAAEMMPWPEAGAMRAFSGLAANIHHKLGDIDAAVRFGRMEGTPVHVRLADRLEQRLPERRVLLDVPFVRQAHKTCAPATLTSLCQFHGHPADHVSIVEEICYDGTPAASERRWAESHALVARHFTVTWDAAVALIDRGLPFSLLSVAPGSAHLQAIAGYDVQRGSFLIRDPSSATLVEMDAAATLEQQAFAGPQGMVLLPAARAAELEGIVLPDAELHDGLYRLQVALLAHRREEAEVELAGLRARAPASVITLAGQRALASYDGNQAVLLLAYDQWLVLHPQAVPALLGRLSCLENLARDEQRRTELEAAATRPGADPLFGRMYAEALARDGRHRDTARLLLQAAIRVRREDAFSYALLGDIASNENDFADAHALARAAVCLEETNEGHALRYFYTARVVGRPDEALAFLRGRVERLGKRSAGPWHSLYSALVQIDRLQEAEDVLAAAGAARSEDGDVAAMRAWAALRRGRIDEARRLSAGAEGRIRKAEYARLAAEIDRLSGDRASAVVRWRSVLETDPLSMEAHAAIARLLNESGDRLAGLAHLRDASARHPHHAGLARLVVEFTDVEGPEGLEVVRGLLTLAPSDAWAVRELALRLVRRHRAEEALVAADEAALLDPHAAATHGIRGFALAAAGKREAAREAYRTALRYAADYVSAFHGLLDEQNDVADRLRAIRFLQAELRRQVVFGDALPAVRDAARGVLPDDDILAFLEEARTARLDLLGAWTAVIDLLVAMGRMDEARARAREATERFPLVVDPLLQLAEIEGLRDDEAARRETLRRALEIEPGHARATQELADALADAGDVDAGLRLLETSCERAPLHVSNHGVLADLLARAGRLPEALARAQRALEIDPDYDWAWNALMRWATTHDLKDQALAVANAVVAARPHVACAHIGRARVLGARRGREAEVLAALKQALECEPRLVDAHDQYAVALSEVGRWDDALAACRPGAFGDTPPQSLRGRRAWILAARGDVAQAIEEMEVVVAENPNYLWGFLRLDDWYFGTGDHVQARRVSERALLLAPNLAEPALGLFDACLALRDYAACRRALDAVRGPTEPSFVLAREVQLACARHLPREGLAPFEKLAALAQASPWALVEASRGLAAEGADRAVRQTFDRIVTSGDRPDADAVGAAWARAVAAQDDLAVVTRIRRFIAAGRAGQAAIAAHVEALAGADRKGALVFLWLIARKAMASATAVWGAFGFALVRFGWYRRALRWMHDHARRPDVESWMLRNLAIALLARGRYDEARAAHARALTLAPDHVTDTHRRWLALYDALGGRTADATRHLDGCSPTNDKLSALLEGYTRALLATAADGATDRAKLLQAAASVEQQHAELFRDDEARFARRLVRHVLRGDRALDVDPPDSRPTAEGVPGASPN